MTIDTQTFPDRNAAETACANWLGDRLEAALSRTTGRLSLLLSGGSTPTRVLPALLKRELDWARVDCVASDERVVSPDHPDSTEGMIRRLFSESGRPIVYAGLKGDTEPDDALSAWRATRAGIAWPPAVGLIGIGDDGHTASLFPGRPEAEDLSLLDAAVPETAPHRHPRLTLGLAALGQCPELGLVVAGAGKSRALLTDTAGLFEALGNMTQVTVFKEADAASPE